VKVFEAIAKAVVEEGCDKIFGLMGDGNMYLWGAIGRDKSTSIYSARHEGGAVGMADGYSRITGKIGLATVTWGPGLTQAATALTVAARNRSPVIVMLGEQSRKTKDRTQHIDHQKVAEVCGARYHTLTHADSWAEELAEAFYTARVGRNAVVLNIPMDVQDQTLGWDYEYRPSTTLVPPADQPAATEEALGPILEALINAERPIIVAGRGAKAAAAKAEIIALADRVGALLATSLQGKGWFGGHDFDIGISGTFASAQGEELFAQADFVLGIGAELGHFTTEGGLLYPSAEIARIDIKPAPDQIGPVPGLYVRGDARRAAITLNEMLEKRQVRRAGFRTDATRKVLATPPTPADRPNDGLDPRRLMHNLSETLPDNAIVMAGVGHYWGFTVMHLALPENSDYIATYQFGSIGQAMAQANGVAAAGTGRPQILIEGDGSLMTSLTELETAVRYRFPLVIIVMNDAAFGAEVHKLNAKGFEPELARWEAPDFVAMVKAFGGDGVRLENEDGLGNAVRKGFAAGGVYLIDARVSPTCISDTYRKLHFGLSNTAPLLRPPQQRG
jgi:thiamine pyrophosphate-dependent acetolactate synthase large subunit-like protein